tara:strand:+ start:648 stop:797 length:150 start_codon:yes stop_codon:yes gene_type:complete
MRRFFLLLNLNLDSIKENNEHNIQWQELVDPEIHLRIRKQRLLGHMRSN